MDGPVAAIARVAQLTFVTRNTRDFERPEGLAVVNWTKRGRARSRSR